MLLPTCAPQPFIVFLQIWLFNFSCWCISAFAANILSHALITTERHCFDFFQIRFFLFSN